MLKFAALRPSQSPLFVLKFDLLLATCTSPTTLNSQASSLIYRIATLIVNEYREQGGGTIDFPDDVSRARQKLFRFLDNKFDSEKYRNNVRELTPAILAVLPLEYRGYLVEQDSFMARLAEMEKELSEAKQAVILNAPRHQKLKEISEGIVSMFRVDPDLAGPLMAMVTTMLGAI